MTHLPRGPEEAEKYIRERVRVSRQMVVQAKAHILNQTLIRTDKRLEELLDHVESRKPSIVVINPQVDFLPMLQQVAAWISWTLAGCEAVWELVHANLLLPSGNSMTGELGGIEWTTVVPGSGGSSAGWNFNDLSLLVPFKIARPPSAVFGDEQTLVDPDLFMREISISGIHAEVEEALREAVRCFRHELYTACLAMLGKAAEGAWIELGLALTRTSKAVAQLPTAKLQETLESPTVRIAKKITEVIKLYERQDIFGEVGAQAKVRLQDLRGAVIWADAVRESRNTVHYGVQPSMRNSYEKVGVLLIGAVAHLRLLYLLINASKE